ncbi:PREDICTED: nuclear pore complex protein NUP1-like isoform X3 [Lupinus angustifolius]|uniref:nuclear pore complex protein NUP1-like isoform X3 n=1 Tax=Lupinus angustifolius TaxID=3871 RepID=UPI00092F2CEB|nr:PREDICTED: nuclear pore complex protein NUP1-like isoform X3 [Lupinus angustifolius]
MAPGERENPYEGLGTGGKFRKRPFRRTQTTPYDRPSTSLTIPNGDNNINNNGWFSKVVNPAHKLITYSARSIFSSLFRKRLPPQSQSQSPSETEQEVRNNHLEESAFKQVSINSSGKKQVTFGNGESDAQINCSDGGGLTELEKLLRQKTFTRSEIDHLTALMRSRTVDTPIREEEKRTEVVPSKPMLFSERKDEDPKTPIVENRIEDRLPLTPYVTSSVPIEDVASPAELAKAYMGSRPSKVSSSIFGVRSPAAREDPAFLKSNDNLRLSSPIMSIVPSTVKHIGVHENGYATARTRGRSAIYSMARTPYARIYPTSTFKRIGHAVEGEPSSSTHSTMDQDMLYGSKQGSVKRRSSALDNDVGSVGPIRRIRHKANLYSKGLGLPPSGSSLSIARSGLGVGAAQQPSSSMRKPIMWDEVKHSHMDLPEENVEDTRPSKSGPLPSKSSEMASKILQQLDKMVSPKEKSSESRLPNVNDKSPMKLSPSMLHGQTLRSMEAVDSSKSLDTVKDNRFNIAPGRLFDSAQKLTSQIDKVENGQLKLVAPSDGLVPAVTDADSTNPRNQIISAAKSVDSFVIKSASHPPQKKRAFHMSAQEDCLDMDDDAYSNGDMSSVLPVDNKMTSPTAMAVKDTFGTESVAQEHTRSLSVVMSSKSSTISKEVHAGADDSVNWSRVGAKVDVSTSMTSSISDPTFKPATAATKTSFGSHKPGSPNGSSTISPVFNFGNKMAPSKDLTNPGTIFGLEKVVSTKELDADVPLVNFGSNGNAGKVPQMLFTSLPVGGESTLPNISVSSDSKLGSPISSATVSAATDSMPKVRESGNVDAKTNTDSVRSSEIPVSSAVTTLLFTSPTSVFTFGQSSGSLAASPSLSSPFTSQNVFSSSPLAASSSSISASSTPSIISSSSSSFSNPLVASSSSTTPIFKFGSSPVPSTGLPVSSSGSEPLETKNREVVGNGNLSSTVFGSSSSTVGNTGSGLFGFSSSAMTTVNSQSQGYVIGSSSGSMFNAQASPATSGFATSTQTQSVPLGSSASSSSFGFTGNTAFSSGNSLFPSTPATNAGFSFGSSSFPSSSSATNIFNSGTTFGLGTPASSSAVNSVSSNNVSSSSLFGSSSWQPNKSSPFGSAFNQTSTAPVASTSSPTMFSSTPQFSFTSAAATTSTQPTFGNPNSGFTFGSAPVNNDQMTMEDSMAEDTVQATPPATPVFGQQATPPATPVFGQQATPPATPVFGQQATPPATPVFGQQATPPATPVFGQQATPPATPIFGQQATPPATPVFGQQATPPATPVFGQQPAPVQSNFVFGASTPSGASPFQFASQQNTTPPNPSPFQASGSVEFSAGGGSFSLGTGGGDKSGRRIVKVKGRQRKR